MQLNLFEENTQSENEKLLRDLFIAYYDARRNKRNTHNQLKFELHFESKLINLHESILARDYTPARSICFMVHKPVQREIFAADFLDRVIHHLLYNYIAPVFEKTFIHDSYSCRVGKGTHYGIKRIDHFIRSCSQNYRHDCYILKLDIKGYFMSMNKSLLYEKVKSEILRTRHKHDFDIPLVLYLIEKTIFNDPKQNCIIKGRNSDWQGLPKSKSLFQASENCGLPIGNLTSQLFGNVYLNDFDHWVKKSLGIKYYGRYVYPVEKFNGVDDFVLIHNNKSYLQSCVNHIKEYLEETVDLDLHPKKIYLQHFSKGVQYLGANIKPHRIYIANRTKGNFYEAIEKQNAVVSTGKPSKEDKDAFLSSMNSYLGIMAPCKASQNGIHYNTYKLRKKMINKHLSGWWGNHVYPVKFGKFVFKVRRVKERDKINLLY